MTAAARPYRAATYTLSVDGQDFTPGVRPRLKELCLTEKRAGEADELSLELYDHDGRLALPKRGGEVTVTMGWRAAATSTGAQPDPLQGLVRKGPFLIDEVGMDFGGAPDTITVRARSADFTGDLRTRAERSWKASTLGAVIRGIAARHGLEAHIAPALDAKPLPVLQQSRESDGALMERLGHLYDAAATIKGGKLIFAPAGAGVTASGAMLPAFTFRRGVGDRASYTEAKREEYDGVSAAWHDTASASVKTVSAGAVGRVKRLRRKFASAVDAQAAADGEHSRIQRASATLALCTAFGRLDVAPESKGQMVGFKPEIDARTWLVTTATHRLAGDGGLASDFDLESTT